ncbi:MAG TPA: hypothetical protein VNJ28_02840, partial [Candidatus Limnocylindrales bacterium]|nr:hypothetical protein [Candidatus Limnocylindrales bacterium]
ALAPLGAWPSVASAAEQRLPVFAVTPSFVLENPIRWSVPHDGSYELARDRPIVMDRVRLDMLQLITERSSAVGASWLR